MHRKLIISSVFLLIVISGMIVTLSITPKYEAVMTILISREQPDPQTSASETPAEINQKEISDAEFNSELEMIKNGEVISAAVRDLNLIGNQAPANNTFFSGARNFVKTKLYNLFSADAKETEETKPVADDFTVEKAINRVANNLDVVPVKSSRIIKISYTDTDPLRAKDTLAKIYEKYFELHKKLNEKLRIGEKRQAGKIFKQQTNSYNEKLQSATKRLKSFDAENGISGTEITTQRELLLKQFYEAQTQLNTTQTEIVESREQIADLNTKIKAQPEHIQVGSNTKYVSALDRMKEELISLEQQKTQLMQKYLPSSRPVRDIEERISQLKKSIARETENPPQEKSFALNDLRRKLMSELFTAETRLATLKEREKNLLPLVASLKSQSLQLNNKSIERTNLERDRSVNEEAYLLYQKKLRENEVSQVLNNSSAMSSEVIDAPRTDGEVKNPKLFLNLLVLIFIGLTAGLAAAIILDKFDSAAEDDLIISAYEIEERLNLPLLAVISDIKYPEIETPKVRQINFPRLPKKKTGNFPDPPP